MYSRLIIVIAVFLLAAFVIRLSIKEGLRSRRILFAVGFMLGFIPGVATVPDLWIGFCLSLPVGLLVGYSMAFVWPKQYRDYIEPQLKKKDKLK
jgi:hypothetical protein